MVSDNCAGLGKFKGPILHGLAARTCFYNGSAITQLDVVNFYDERFGIGFTAQQKADFLLSQFALNLMLSALHHMTLPERVVSCVACKIPPHRIAIIGSCDPAVPHRRADRAVTRG